MNLDVTSPAATLALGLMFLRTNDPAIAAAFALPDTRFALDYVRPDFIMLRILARSLVVQDSVLASQAWVEAQLPPLIKVPSLTQSPAPCSPLCVSLAGLPALLLTHSLAHPLSRSLALSPSLALTHSPTHPPTRPLTHPHTHPPTHSLIYSPCQPASQVATYLTTSGPAACYAYSSRPECPLLAEHGSWGVAPGFGSSAKLEGFPKTRLLTGPYMIVW